MTEPKFVEHVASMLRASRLRKIAVAESITSGMIQSALASVSGASEYLLGGVTSYSPDSKTSVLGIEPEVVARNEAVTPDVAVAMAESVCRLFGAHIGVGLLVLQSDVKK